MKEFLKNYFFGFVLGALIFGPLSYVTATTIAARNITYNGTNTNVSLTNVQDAIEELYRMNLPKPQSINIVLDAGSNGSGSYFMNSGMCEYIQFNDNNLIATVTYKDGTSRRIYRSEYTLTDDYVQISENRSDKNKEIPFSNTLTYTENGTTVSQSFDYTSEHDGGPC
jgi:hypothetical protein